MPELSAWQAGNWLVLATADDADDAMVSGEWIKSEAIVDVEGWQ